VKNDLNQMKKVIWIDIGTHFAQEYNSIFGANFNFYQYIIRRLIGGNIFGRGKSISIQDLKKIISARSYIRKRKKDFFSIFIEANPNIIYKKKVYRSADIFFNIALTDNAHSPLSIINLYLGGGGELSQSGSLFSDKHKKFQNNFLPVLGVSTDTFFKSLKKYICDSFKDYAVILRLNCEGVEDSVIYSAHACFEEKLELICGALKDVAELKGVEAFNNLEKFISDNQIPFANFASPVSTWAEGQNAIQDVLKKSKIT
jgi:hypothetical protein